MAQYIKYAFKLVSMQHNIWCIIIIVFKTISEGKTVDFKTEQEDNNFTEMTSKEEEKKKIIRYICII